MMKHRAGFSLIEVLVGIGLFLVVATAVYSSYVSLIKLANANQARIVGIQLANEQFEIVRNMPYVNVGLTNGIPIGVLQQNQTLIRGGFTYTVTLVVRNIDLATSTLQASSKLVEVNIACASCKQGFDPIVLTGYVSPANLQSAASGGALIVQVFDSNGIPIQGATVVVQSTATSSITNTDITNNNGTLEIIGVPPGANVYRVTVSKTGFSTARTYAPGDPSNPNPSSADITIVAGEVSQVSLSIDALSELNFTSVSPTCQPVGNFHFNLTGEKQIGQGVPKYSEDLGTDAGGTLALNPMEWDTYTLTPADSTHDANGITPFSPIALNAGNTQNIQLVVVPQSPNSLMVAVQDSALKLPLSGATVELSGNGYDRSEVTGQGFFSQTDWSGGSGQSAFLIQNKYAGDDGSVDVSTSSGNVVLKQVFDEFSPSGQLESSTFDTGSPSNFYSLFWTPINQPAFAGQDPIRFQVATTPSTTPDGPWTYLGPDGSATSYYTVPGTQISGAAGNQYLRYMMYLSTETATVTPSISDVSFTYTSDCIPPGQVLFQGLTAGDYTLTISKSGYVTWSGTVTVGAGWQNTVVNLEQ